MLLFHQGIISPALGLKNLQGAFGQKALSVLREVADYDTMPGEERVAVLLKAAKGNKCVLSELGGVLGPRVRRSSSSRGSCASKATMVLPGLGWKRSARAWPSSACGDPWQLALLNAVCIDLPRPGLLPCTALHKHESATWLGMGLRLA